MAAGFRSRLARLTLIGVAAAGTWPLGAAPAPRGRPPAEVRERVFHPWYEDETVVAGRPWPGHKFEPLGWRFGADWVDSWQLTGELTTHPYNGGARIDVSRTPWRLDLLSREADGTVWALPTIFKFDGDDLVWVAPFPGEGWQKLDPAGDCTGRPTEFTSTQENRQTYRRLKRCEYLQTQFPAGPGGK